MHTFKHSGAFGDLIYSLALVRHFGGGEFYLHLHQIDWIGQHYYGSQPAELHRGRLSRNDYFQLLALMQEQAYISKFEILAGQEITHNLDRFRPLFVHHPSNYIRVYAEAFGIRDPETLIKLETEPWLTVSPDTSLTDRPIVINRTERWLPPTLAPEWTQWLDLGWDAKSTFIGTEVEYAKFKTETGWSKTTYTPTEDLRSMAQVIDQADLFIGNQSLALALAIGLGKTSNVELRRDLPLDRNECVFKNNTNLTYF